MGATMVVTASDGWLVCKVESAMEYEYKETTQFVFDLLNRNNYSNFPDR